MPVEAHNGQYRIKATFRQAYRMNTRAHWEKIYSTKPPDALSWYTPHLEKSLALIERASSGSSSSIVDVGGGESTLAGDLLARGYQHVSVLDISETALAVAKQRLGPRASRIHWLVADVTSVFCRPCSYDVWHDRAVFHFMTLPEQRSAYVHAVARAVRPGGHAIVSTFGPEGPTKCSGLDVVRYDDRLLHDQFGERFRLLENLQELHSPAFGPTHQFQYCFCRVE